MHVSKKILISRREIRLDQKAFGEKIGKSANTVHRWETGKTEPSLKDIQLIATVTGRSLSFFLEEGTPAPSPPALPPISPEIQKALADPAILQVVELLYREKHRFGGIIKALLDSVSDKK